MGCCLEGKAASEYLCNVAEAQNLVLKLSLKADQLLDLVLSLIIFLLLELFGLVFLLGATDIR